MDTQKPSGARKCCQICFLFFSFFFTGVRKRVAFEVQTRNCLKGNGNSSTVSLARLSTLSRSAAMSSSCGRFVVVLLFALELCAIRNCGCEDNGTLFSPHAATVREFRLLGFGVRFGRATARDGVGDLFPCSLFRGYDCAALDVSGHVVRPKPSSGEAAFGARHLCCW